MSSSSRPNILYIMTDQQRYDSLGCVGRSICKTPHLDGLASAGIRFDNAYTVCALCSPARASMLTGRYPHSHHMWNNNDMFQWVVRDLPPDERLISQDLAEVGYSCGYSGKWHCGWEKVPSTYGFTGMDVANYGNPYDTKKYAEYLTARGVERPVRHSAITRWGGGTLSGTAEACEPHYVAGVAIDLMRQMNEERGASGRPFMMFVSFWGPHHPCFVPEPYASMYDPANVELWPNFWDGLDNKPRVQSRFLRTFYPEAPILAEDVWRELIALYWGFCTFIDVEIGRLLGALNQMGRAQDTVVLFSTDHGDMMGSHGRLFDKGPFMYEETYHIPLIVHWPGVTSPGAICNKLISNMDLATTALDIAGLPVPDYYDGRSLVPLLGDSNAGWRDDLMCEFHGHRFLYSQRMVRWANYKYIFNAPDEDELYDLGQDPHELVNQIDSPAYAEIAEQGRQRLLKWMEDSGDPLRNQARWMFAVPQ